MPVFEYVCKDCGITSEFLVGIVQNAPDPHCSACGSSELAKKFSRTNAGTRTKTSEQGDLSCDMNDRCNPDLCRSSASCPAAAGAL